MVVVGFSFSKIFIEKKEAIPSKVEVKSKINVNDIFKEDIKLVEKKDVLRFNFTYEIEYAPNLAKIDFTGHLLVVVDPKEAEEVIKNWKKNKSLDSKIKLNVYNTIFNKCNVKAFELEEDFNLPLHLRLPLISADK